MSSQDIEQAVYDMLSAELDDLRCAGVHFAGKIYSPILVLKSLLLTRENDPQTALLHEADVIALSKSFEALGFDKQDFCVLLSTHYDDEGNTVELLPELLKLAISSFAPRYIVTADLKAAEQLKQAYGNEVYEGKEGELSVLLGIQLLQLGNFHEALQDPEQKRIMWQRLQQLSPRSVQY